MIRPGGDAFWLAALTHVLFGDDLVDVGILETHLNRVDELQRLVKPFTPEAVADAT